MKQMPWRRSLWIWNAAGRPCGEETKETMKRRRKDGDKAEDADRGEANVRWELGRRGDWCASVRVGAPIWRSHTSRWGRAGWCTYMAKPPGFFFFPSPLEQVHLYGKATLKSWGAVLLYALVCGMTNQPKQKGGLAKGVDRCTYMVKPPGVFPERFIRAVGEGEPGRCT